MTEPTEKTPTDNTPAENTPTEKTTPTMLEQMGGPIGLAYTGIPIVVFVLANSVIGLAAGIWSAVGVALAICVVRVIRKEPVQPALSGLFGVAVAAFIAYRTGSAKGFFLVGIWTSLAIAVVLVLTVVFRRPLVGVVVNAVTGRGSGWRRDRVSLHAYDIATLTLAAVSTARFVVQRWLYDQDSTGWLAFAKIAMGYPLLALAMLVVVWAVRRSGDRA